ncbi:hypothetical protein L798_09404 [Zootermopsis nevadensis]|uniref:Uncharacterized protein n=1 Tax=Zootermopsis nevadensis TaxID=136037 RepID=A0A067RW22_ZOONE|nr:hypothetical protein L798_09404 [Zootermopsis nevadensis]
MYRRFGLRPDKSNKRRERTACDSIIVCQQSSQRLSTEKNTFETAKHEPHSFKHQHPLPCHDIQWLLCEAQEISAAPEVTLKLVTHEHLRELQQNTPHCLLTLQLHWMGNLMWGKGEGPKRHRATNGLLPSVLRATADPQLGNLE